MEKRISALSANLLEQSFSFGRYLFEVCERLYNVGYIDPISWGIVKSVDRFNLPAVAALCITILRYSDLARVDYTRYLSGKPTFILQGKTNLTFMLRVLPSNAVSGLGPLPSCPVRFPSTYSSVRYALSRVIPRDVHAVLEKSVCKTHVFRHLAASWMNFQGCGSEFISTALGHSPGATWREYVHSDLDTLFLSH